jgi:hypothetical protein
MFGDTTMLKARLKRMKASLQDWLNRYGVYLAALLALLGIGILVVSLGALFSWSVMVGLLLSIGLPLLTVEIVLTVIGVALVLPGLIYSIKRGVKHIITKRNFVSAFDALKMKEPIPVWKLRLKYFNKWQLTGLAVVSLLSIAALTLGIGILCHWAVLVNLVPFGLPAVAVGSGLTVVGTILLFASIGYITYQIRKREAPVAVTKGNPRRSAHLSIPALEPVTPERSNRLSQALTSARARVSTFLFPPPVQPIDPAEQPPEIYSRGHIKQGQLLGQGAFGKVYRATYNKDGYQNVLVAIKELNQMDHDAETDFKNEAQLMQKLDHPNVVKIYGYDLDKRPYWIIMEYLNKGSLADHLYPKESKFPLNEKVQKSIAKDIFTGVAYLHKYRIIHRDLKSMNILLDETMHAKVADFGLAKPQKTQQEQFKTMTQASAHGTAAVTGVNIVGTMLWLAPEILDDRHYVDGKIHYTEKSDVYACGLIIWELATQQLPFGGNQFKFLDAVATGKRDKIPNSVPERLASVISLCWQHDKSKRPSAEVALTWLNSPLSSRR